MYKKVLAMMWDESPLRWGVQDPTTLGLWWTGWPPQGSSTVESHLWHWAGRNDRLSACGMSPKAESTHSLPFPSTELNSNRIVFPVRVVPPAYCNLCLPAALRIYGDVVPNLPLHREIGLLHPNTEYWALQHNLMQMGSVYSRVAPGIPHRIAILRHMRLLLEPVTLDLFMPENGLPQPLTHSVQRVAKLGTLYRNIFMYLKRHLEYIT